MLKVIPQDVGSDPPSHTGSGFLIETVVDPTVYPGIIDIVSHLRERGVVESHVHRPTDAGQGDGVVALAVGLLSCPQGRVDLQCFPPELPISARSGLIRWKGPF